MQLQIIETQKRSKLSQYFIIFLNFNLAKGGKGFSPRSSLPGCALAGIGNNIVF